MLVDPFVLNKLLDVIQNWRRASQSCLSDEDDND